MDLATRRRRASLFFFFLIPGLSISSWVTRTPDIRDQLGASTAQMGLVLFGLSVGSMLGILSSGALVARFGTRPVMGVGTALIVAGSVAIGCGALFSSAPAVTAGLFLFGAGMGGGEVAVNIDGAEVERITGRTVLPTLHGFFSLGTVVGAALGILCTAVEFPVQWHLGGMAVVTAGMFAYAIRAIPAGVGRTRRNTADGGTAPARPAVWKDRRLLLIGGIILAMALAEGAANDWLPLLMVDGHGVDPALGSAVYAGFAAAMTLGRFCGGFFIDRFGRAPVVRASALSAALGLALVIFADSPVLAGAAVLFWGLGASLGFPVALSAAGDSGPDAAARVSLVAMIGYIAFLVGPPSLGFLGDHYGLRSAMIVVLAFVAVAVFLAPAIGTRRATVAGGAPATADEQDEQPVTEK
ncbi:MFS transporter [Streptomyces sp. NE06-03E]|uniref:MFS transporter n=1 Tax=unclassified Streptomyces TaxID=2593676 RepID=UPI0029BF8923|nr:MULTISPECIES: MFS transporter [unclassified Streptomyces]MDX3058165.1 MFS transporter [Streptomyces sp. NE06-03E]MDX3428969.1 MFS transporter [Streptomyces sp. ME01-18a]WSS62100.1 MFS transporter [Streptomyces sp. NBC_01177]WSS69122.1 MFS transporter [Streptomyces sp. NBC_01175]